MIQATIQCNLKTSQCIVFRVDVTESHVRMLTISSAPLPLPYLSRKRRGAVLRKWRDFVHRHRSSCKLSVCYFCQTFEFGRHI